MKLTIKQRRFCERYVECGDASAAYRQSYNAEGMKPATVNRSAKELLDHPKITARLDELRELANEAFSVTMEAKLRRLWEIAQEDDGRAVSAISEMNRMTGDIAPRKTENRHQHATIVFRDDFSGKNAPKPPMPLPGDEREAH